MRHFGMKPRTTEVGAKEQNGDVEAGQRRAQAAARAGAAPARQPRLRDRDEYAAFLAEAFRRGQRGRRRATAVVPRTRRRCASSTSRAARVRREDVRVSEWSTVRVKHCAYSVPSRLIGEWVRVRILRGPDRGLLRRQAPARVRAAARSQRHADRLPPRDLVAGAQAGGVRALRLPRGDVPVAWLPAGVRRAPAPHEAPAQGRPRVPADPPPRGEHDGGRRGGRAGRRCSRSGEAIDRETRSSAGAARRPLDVPELTRRRWTSAPTTRCSPDGRRRSTSRRGAWRPCHRSAADAAARAEAAAFARYAEEVAQKAEREGWTFGQYLHHLAELEVQERRRRRIERDLRGIRPARGEDAGDAGLRACRRRSPKLPTLCEGGFVERGENLLAFGLPGRGKTHLVARSATS